MSRFSLTLPVVLIAAALGASGQDGCSLGSPSGEDAAVVARIDERPLTQGELDNWIRDRLFERELGSKSEAERYEYRAEALDEMIGELVLEREASRLGLSKEEMLDRAVESLGPVGEEEVSEFFEKHRDRFRPGDTLERRGEQIRRFLEHERGQKALDVLRATADIGIELEPPRFEVASAGPALGPEQAPVTIVEFSDFQCPFCSRAEPIVRQVLERYPEQVRLVYRHMPLDSIHPRARPAAEAAVCAEEQGRFWEYHEKLFANQGALADQQLELYASELNLDMEAFAQCLQRPEVKARVQGDVEAAEAAGVKGTPAFLVNGILLSGARPVEEFVRVIERELARADDS
jgi:predicted DsbA family dithiol-disulfide isomerase